MNMNSYAQKLYFGQSVTSSTSASARPMAVGNMHQSGYPSHDMTGGHDSVMSICLACQVCNSSCRRSDGMFSTAVLCLRSISSESCDSEGCPFINGRARLLHTQLWLRPNVTVATLAPARPMAVGNTTERAIHPTA